MYEHTQKKIDYLISVVKTVIHEPCYQRCFPNCNQQNRIMFRFWWITHTV